jgi:hypothetical protein
MDSLVNEPRNKFFRVTLYGIGGLTFNGSIQNYEGAALRNVGGV